MDGWVKTAQGPAIAGAQIYVCTQPANIPTIPPAAPSPLALIYSDPNGLVPIAQPIITDGFGHYDFYALPGLYTVVVSYNGVVQNYYTDQSLGAVGTGGGGTSLVLEVNGTPTSNQLLLNLASGSGVTLADLGGGTVQISASSSGITLQTNGTNNTDQALLNLIAGTGVSLVAGGTGGVTITNTSTGTTFGTSGVGFFWGPGFTGPLFSASISAGTLATTARAVYVFEFTLDSSWTIRTASYMSDNGASSAYFGFGIYSLAGNALLTTSFLSTATSSNTPVTNTFTAVTLPAGTYYFAQSCDNTSVEGVVFLLGYVGQSGVNLYGLMNANSQPVAMLATNVMSTNTGVMPSTLGTLTALTNQAIGGLGAVKWTP